MEKTIILCLGILMMMPVILAECPTGFICGGGSTTVITGAGVNYFCSNEYTQTISPEGKAWLKTNEETITFIRNSTGTNSNCLYKDSSGAELTCCPTDMVYDCINMSSADSFPLWPVTNIHSCMPGHQFCGEYNTSSTCEASGGHPAVAKNDLNKSGRTDANTCGQIRGAPYSWNNGTAILTCYNVTRCLCDWHSNECAPKMEIYKSCSDNREYETDDSCTLIGKETINECDTLGIITFKYREEPGPSYSGIIPCGGEKTKVISCEEIVKLGFFNYINFILAGLIIGGVYIRIGRRNSKNY